MRDRPARWLLAVVAVNSAASLTAIALWAFVPCRGVTARCPPAPGPAGEAGRPAVAAQAAPPWTLPLVPRGQPAAQRAGGAAGEAPQAAVRMPTRRAARPVSAATNALAGRLNLNPDALVDLCDDDGALPKATAARLERGFDTGRSIAKRVGADEGRTQSIVALVTYYAFSVLLEERRAAPSAPDRARIDELQSTLVEDVRTTCGNAVAEAVKNDLGSL